MICAQCRYAFYSQSRTYISDKLTKARYNLENMMITQLNNRRKETKFIHEFVLAQLPPNALTKMTLRRKCDMLEKRFTELKGLAETLKGTDNSVSPIVKSDALDIA